MVALTWRDAEHSDRTAFQAFECTQKPTKSAATKWRVEHPREWEIEVQSAIRALKPPVRNGDRILVAEDSIGIAAVSHFTELGSNPAQVELCEMAVSVRHRGTGVADQMMSETLDAITQRAVEVGVGLVEIRWQVWHENGPSQRMCRRVGGEVIGCGAPGVQLWALDLVTQFED